MTTARLEAVGSRHTARFGEDFDHVLAALLTQCHDFYVASQQLDELTLLTVLAEFAADGGRDPRSDTGGPRRGDMASGQITADEDDPRIRHFRYAIYYRPGSIIDLVTFEGITLRSDQTVVRHATVTTVRNI